MAIACSGNVGLVCNNCGNFETVNAATLQFTTVMRMRTLTGPQASYTSGRNIKCSRCGTMINLTVEAWEYPQEIRKKLIVNNGRVTQECNFIRIP